MVARTPDTSGKTGSEELARVIRERRERLGLSRQELADAARIPYPTLAQIETAYRGVSPARLGVIGRVLGLDPKELYDLLATPESEAEEHVAGIAAAPTVAAPVVAAPAEARAAAGSWHPNRRFAAAPTAAPAVARAARRLPAADVVEQVAGLMAGVPADERIAVLAQIQTRVLDDLVAERSAGVTDGG